MRALVQRVSHASVTVGGETVGAIGTGLLVLLGVGHDDGEAEAERLAAKVVKLRVFDDGEGRMNLGLRDVAGAALVVSQFTLYGDVRRGNRPGYGSAARPETAEPLYERFAAEVRGAGVEVATGRFGATMEVALVNHGPVTLWLDTEQL